jgi:hypothetical protein
MVPIGSNHVDVPNVCYASGMTIAETPRTWAEVVTTDYVWSAKRSAWFEVIETWAVGDRVHFRLRGAEKTQDLPAATPVRVRRSQMGATVDMVVSIMSSGPNGYRDAGTDQMDPFISRIRGIRRRADTEADTDGRPRTGWDAAKTYVLNELHEEAMTYDQA